MDGQRKYADGKGPRFVPDRKALASLALRYREEIIHLLQKRGLPLSRRAVLPWKYGDKIASWTLNPRGLLFKVDVPDHPELKDMQFQYHALPKQIVPTTRH